MRIRILMILLALLPMMIFAADASAQTSATRKSKKTTASSKVSTNKKKTVKKIGNTPTVKDVKYSPVPTNATALLEPLGYPCPEGDGVVSAAVSKIPKLQSAQVKWVSKVPLPQLMTNKSLADECVVITPFVEGGKNEISMQLLQRYYDVNGEFAARRDAIKGMIGLIKESRDRVYGDGQSQLRRLADIIGSDIYKRMLKSSITPFEKSLTAEELDYFNKRGGLAKATTATKTKWEAIANKTTVATSQNGVTGVLQSDGTIDVNGMFFRLHPKRSNNDSIRAYLERTADVALTGKNVVVPSHIEWKGNSYPVVEIRAGAFQGSKMKLIKLPNTLKKIGKKAFSAMKYVTSIEIPGSVVELNGAFDQCPVLREVIIPNSVKVIGGACFMGCPKLTTVKLPKKVKKFGQGVFENCTSLASVTLPSNLSSIPVSTFSGCTNLTGVVIPKRVKVIRSSAFSGCTRLTSIVIPNSVTEIESMAFTGCKALRSVTLPSRFNNIQELAMIFLGTGVMPNSNSLVSMPKGFHFVDTTSEK